MPDELPAYGDSFLVGLNNGLLRVKNFWCESILACIIPREVCSARPFSKVWRLTTKAAAIFVDVDYFVRSYILLQIFVPDYGEDSLAAEELMVAKAF